MSPSRITAAAACVIGLAFVAAGCGGGTTSGGSVPTPVPSSVAPTTPAPPTVAASSPAPVASPTPSAAPSASASPFVVPSGPTPSAQVDLSAKSLAGIISPSGHIACLFDGPPTAARCDVNDAHWGLTTPKSCPLAYGDSAEVGAGSADLTCHGDTVFGAPNQPVLPYGQSVRYQTIVCTSQTTGITCRNAKGHGFMVSRDGYHLF